MHFIIQLASKEHLLKGYTEALNALGVNYSFVSYFDEHNEFSGLPETDEPLYSVSAVSFLNALNSKKDLTFIDNDHQNIKDPDFRTKFRNSYFYTNPENFDQRTAITHGMPMLNRDAMFIDLKKDSGSTFDKDMFIKPSDDLKSFIGGILPAGQSIRDFVLNNSAYMRGWDDNMAIVASPKQIHSEYRFFVVNKKVITGSRYFLEGNVDVSNIIPDPVLNEANKLAKMFQPDNAFTMDLALMIDESISIVEYNCINISGHYHCNLLKFIDALKIYHNLY